jgi:hypothetical protein
MRPTPHMGTNVLSATAPCAPVRSDAHEVGHGFHLFNAGLSRRSRRPFAPSMERSCGPRAACGRWTDVLGQSPSRFSGCGTIPTTEGRPGGRGTAPLGEGWRWTWRTGGPNETRAARPSGMMVMRPAATHRAACAIRQRHMWRWHATTADVRGRTATASMENGA